MVILLGSHCICGQYWAKGRGCGLDISQDQDDMTLQGVIWVLDVPLNCAATQNVKAYGNLRKEYWTLRQQMFWSLVPWTFVTMSCIVAPPVAKQGEPMKPTRKRRTSSPG